MLKCWEFIKKQLWHLDNWIKFNHCILLFLKSLKFCMFQMSGRFLKPQSKRIRCELQVPSSSYIKIFFPVDLDWSYWFLYFHLELLLWCLSVVLYFNTKLFSVCSFLLTDLLREYDACNIRILFLMPQHAVDISSTPNVSPPSGSLASCARQPRLPGAGDRLSCCVVWS